MTLTTFFFFIIIDKTTHREQFNPCENDGEQIVMHSCLWASCTAQAPTLNRLMTHICENHIGSGKVITHNEPHVGSFTNDFLLIGYLCMRLARLQSK